VGAVVVAAALLAACDVHVVQQIDDERAAAGVAPVTRNAALDQRAGDHVRMLCKAGITAPAADPLALYDAETVAAADDLAGSAVLDQSIEDPVVRNVTATKEIVAGWAGDPMLVDARWDDVGIAERTCADGRLYVAAAFTARPAMPASGRFSTAIYAASQITRTRDLKYGTAVNHQGQTIDLYLDVWTPPAGPTPTRPLVVLVHGGGFQGGNREAWAQGATDLARLGFVTASISYRLRPAGASVLPAAADAIDDGMEAVRWLKANAARFAIDTTRIAAMGDSAGGVVALGLALADDQSPGGPLASHSPSVAAAASAGGHLTPGLPILDLRAEQPAILMVNWERDPTGGDAVVAFETCAAVRTSGNTCDFLERPGEGHLSWFTPGSPIWTTHTGPFLWQQLRLG
jgi:dienelactone hydrolase